jgi:phosphatidylserine/phosphatidylglycerophosphate/cardiolipin synthase-like enzyme
LVFTPQAHEALKKASQRGVKLIFFTASPQSSDEPLVQGIFVKDWKNILKDFPTARLFVTDKRPLHSKIFIFDRKLTIIGTYNFDPLSQNINSEVMSAILSEKFANELVGKLQKLIDKYCVEYKLKILPDGTEKVIFGPENHCDKMHLLKLKLIFRQIAKLIRPLI